MSLRRTRPTIQDFLAASREVRMMEDECVSYALKSNSRQRVLALIESVEKCLSSFATKGIINVNVDGVKTAVHL